MLSNLKVNTTKLISVPYPKFPTFIVKLNYISREELQGIRKQASVIKYNPVTRQREDTVESDVFLEEYVRKAVKDWSGLTMEIVAKLVPIDTKGQDLNSVVPFTEDDALWLVKNSPDFDAWFSDMMNQVDVFTREEKEEVKKS